jgi:Holliday junction resolvase-like predicted endonuclease
MAADYLARYRLHRVPARFDVVAVTAGDGAPRVELIADAFRPGW